MILNPTYLALKKQFDGYFEEAESWALNQKSDKECKPEDFSSMTSDISHVSVSLQSSVRGILFDNIFLAKSQDDLKEADKLISLE